MTGTARSPVELADAAGWPPASDVLNDSSLLAFEVGLLSANALLTAIAAWSLWRGDTEGVPATPQAKHGLDINVGFSASHNGGTLQLSGSF